MCILGAYFVVVVVIIAYMNHNEDLKCLIRAMDNR
jgi:hypothetical protein